MEKYSSLTRNSFGNTGIEGGKTFGARPIRGEALRAGKVGLRRQSIEHDLRRVALFFDVSN